MSLDHLFDPGSVAVIGASDHEGKVGYRVLRNLRTGGYGGAVVPVNLDAPRVQGLDACARVGEIAEPPDLAVICTPAPTVPGLLRECGEAGVGGVVVLSAGFRETGDKGARREERVRQEAERFPRMRVLGPNCLGIMVPGIGLNASFAGSLPEAGDLAFVSQSGALCTAVLDWALEEGIGFSHFISVGNAVDVGFADLIDYLGGIRRTSSVLLYIESVSRPREFLSAARAFARSKPVVAYKAGRFAESAHAAASHTGAMAGDDAVFDAAARRAGIERVYGLREMFDCAELLALAPRPSGGSLAIVTNAGGPGVMATDALMARSGDLARLSDATRRRLDELIPAGGSTANPVDVRGDALPDRFAAAARVLEADAGVDAMLAILAPQAMTAPEETAEGLASLAEDTDKPVLASWMGGRSMRAAIDILNRARIPTYATPEEAVRAFMHLVAYSRNLSALYETPRDVLPRLSQGRAGARKNAAARLADAAPAAEQESPGLVPEDLSKAVVAAYGIPVVRTENADDPETAVAIAETLGYPVVLKVRSPQVSHKSEVHGVKLDLDDADAVRRAFAQIADSLAQRRPDATLAGVTVQPQIDLDKGVELILGARRDPTFGMIVLVGLGGTATEVLRDIALELPPLNERLARRMLESLRIWPLLQGVRGKAGVDVDAVVDCMLRFSYLVADEPRIHEAEMNPLLATADGVTALDARILVDRGPEDRDTPYGHLAIRPYPQEYEESTQLADGRPVTLRPIRPEDEPMWHELLASCSEESRYTRFFATVRGTSHQMATRYCFIDYDREMAIVAELEQDGHRRLLAVGRLVADPARTTAEYAILVADEFQGQGLGSRLTAYCLQIARRWGVGTVTAMTMAGNVRMTDILRNQGFSLRRDRDSGLVVASRRLQDATS